METVVIKPCSCRTKSGEPWVPEFIESVDPFLCEGCELCVKVCPRKIIEMDLVNNKVVAVPKHSENCIGEGNCERICPYHAVIRKPKI